MTLHLTHEVFFKFCRQLFSNNKISKKRQKRILFSTIFVELTGLERKGGERNRLNHSKDFFFGSLFCSEGAFNLFSFSNNWHSRNTCLGSFIMSRCWCCWLPFYIWLFDEMPKWISIIFPFQLARCRLIYASRRQLCLTFPKCLSWILVLISIKMGLSVVKFIAFFLSFSLNFFFFCAISWDQKQSEEN